MMRWLVPLLIGAGMLPVSAASDDFGALGETVADVRKKAGVPALGALVFRQGQEVALAVDGFRQAGGTDAVAAGDLWHLGSNTKAMTAALVARYVEAGELSFETTMAEAFPEFGDTLPEPARAITLEQLLAHTAGLPANPPPPVFRMLRNTDTPVTDHRRELARWALTQDLLSEPGSEFLYSNVGYIIVGAALETKFGKPWETLLAEEVFAPLGIEAFGFGAPEGDHPRGHHRTGATPDPAGTGFDGDNPAAYGPAGTVHMSLHDWMKFAADQLAGARGETGTLLKPETYQTLHRPRLGGYALGWGVGQNPPRLRHDGSNTYWYARITLLPDRDLGYLVVTNEAGEQGKQAVEQVARQLP